MFRSTLVREVSVRRQPVSVDRVTCWRLGPVVLDRCRECEYLLRLEGAATRDSAAAYVICADDPKPAVDFAW